MFHIVPGSNLCCLMMQLSLLNVSNNKLKYLPESIGICSSLEELQANGVFLHIYLCCFDSSIFLECSFPTHFLVRSLMWGYEMTHQEGSKYMGKIRRNLTTISLDLDVSVGYDYMSIMCMLIFLNFLIKLEDHQSVRMSTAHKYLMKNEK